MRGEQERLANCAKWLDDLQQRVQNLERYEAPAESSEESPLTETRVRTELTDRGVDFEFALLKAGAVLLRAPSDYYEGDLEYRRHCLSAETVEQLCKTIVLENTKAPPEFASCGSHEDSRVTSFVDAAVKGDKKEEGCMQYAARLHADKLKRFVHKLNGRLGVKNFHFRLAPEDVSAALTGFCHNAVTPICMKTRLPIFMSDRIEQLPVDFFWLGGGEVDLKVGMPIRQFIAAYKPVIVDCTYEASVHNASCLSA